MGGDGSGQAPSPRARRLRKLKVLIARAFPLPSFPTPSIPAGTPPPSPQLTFSFAWVDQIDEPSVEKTNVLRSKMGAQHWVDVDKLELELRAASRPCRAVLRHQKCPVATDAANTLWDVDQVA